MAVMVERLTAIIFGCGLVNTMEILYSVWGFFGAFWTQDHGSHGRCVQLGIGHLRRGDQHCHGVLQVQGQIPVSRASDRC